MKHYKLATQAQVHASDQSGTNRFHQHPNTAGVVHMKKTCFIGCMEIQKSEEFATKFEPDTQNKCPAG